MESSGSGEHPSSPEIEKLTSQLAKDPRSKAFIPLAEEYVKVGLPQEAARVLEEGLQVYPAFTTALVALARVYVQVDTPAKAQGILEEVVKKSPDNALAQKMLARIYAKDQNWDAARRSCEMVLFGYAQDEEMLTLKAELEKHGASEAGAQAPQPAVKTLSLKTAQRNDAGPEPAKAGDSPEGPAVEATPSDLETKPTVAPVDSPHEGTGGGRDEAQASGEERPQAEAQTGVAQLQELIERVRQRRALPPQSWKT